MPGSFNPHPIPLEPTPQGSFEASDKGMSALELWDGPLGGFDVASQAAFMQGQLLIALLLLCSQSKPRTTKSNPSNPSNYL